MPFLMKNPTENSVHEILDPRFFFGPINFYLHLKEFSWHGRWRANDSTTLKTFLLLSGCRTSFSQWLFGDIFIFLVSEYFGIVWWITRHIQHWQNMPLVVIYYTRQILKSTYHFKIPIKQNQPTFTNPIRINQNQPLATGGVPKNLWCNLKRQPSPSWTKMSRFRSGFPKPKNCQSSSWWCRLHPGAQGKDPKYTYLTLSFVLTRLCVFWLNNSYL